MAESVRPAAGPFSGRSDQPANAQRRPHLGALTGLRFPAALLIILYHFTPIYRHHDQWPLWIDRTIAGGFSFVSMYFVLSGFVLAYVYCDGKVASFDRKAFWVSRFARVYPVYLLALAMSLPTFLKGALAGKTVAEAMPDVLATVTANATLTQAWSTATVFRLNVPGWAVSVEAFFYLVFPFILPFVSRLGRRQLVALLGCAYVLFLVAPVAYSLSPRGLAPDEWGLSNPLLNLPLFVIGVALGRLFLDDSIGESRGHTLAGWRTSTLSIAAAAVTVGLLPSSIYLSDQLGVHRLLFGDGLLVPAFAALIYSLAFGRGPLAWVLSRRSLLVLGEASYALYILQLPVWSGLAWLGKRLSLPDETSLEFLVLYLPVILTVSLLTLFAVEKPARRWIRLALSTSPRLPARFSPPDAHSH